jgi:hypothetical protein
MGRASALQAKSVRRTRFHCSSLSLCQDQHGSEEQMFGEKQQIPHGGQSDQEADSNDAMKLFCDINEPLASRQ